MKPRAKRFAIALLACSILSNGAWADQASEVLVRGWVESLDKSPDWQAKAGSISSQGNATVIGGLAIAREDGSVSLTGAELRFDDLASSADGLSASAIMAKNLGVTGKPWAVLIPTVEAKGFASPAFGGWSYDAKAPATSLAKLYTVLAKTRLDLFSMPEASFTQDKSSGRYVDVRYEGLADGKLKLQSIGKIESSSPMGPNAPTMNFTIEGMSARNMDLAAFARVVDPDAYVGGKGDGKWMTAVEGGTYGKVTVLADSAPVFTIADISFGDMSVRQTAKPFVGALDELILKSPNQNEDEVLALLSEHLANFVGWFKLSSLTMSDLKFEKLGSDGDRGSLAKASIADISADGMKRFALENFSAEGSGGKFGLKLFEMADVIWPSLALYMEVGKFSSDQSKGKPLDAALAGKIAGSIFDFFPKIGKTAIEGVTINVDWPEALSLESFSQIGTYDGGAIAADTKTELKNLVIPGAVLKADPQAAQVFEALGYDRLAIGGAGVQTYDKTLGAFSDQSRITVEKAGALALYLAFGGLTPERIKAVMVPVVSARAGADPDMMAIIAAANGATFNGFSLRFEDQSLTKRLLAYAAKMQNMDEKTLVANGMAMMQLGLSQLRSPDFAQKTVAAVGAFLNEPKSLTISLKPPAPVGVQQVMSLDPNNPAKAIELFGVSVTAND